MFDAQPGGFFHGLGEELWAAEGEGRIDFVHAVAGNVHVGVTRQGYQGGFAGEGDVQQHDGVGAHGPNVPTGSEALRVFFGQPSTRVGADQEPVGAAGGGNVLGWVGGHPVEPTIEPECAGNSQHEYRNQGPGQPGEAAAGSESGQPEITPVTPGRLVSGRLAALLPLLGASLGCALLAA